MKGFQLMTRPGSVAGETGTAGATLDDVSRVFVDFPLPEGQLSTGASGRAITGRAEAWPGRTFTGNVALSLIHI